MQSLRVLWLCAWGNPVRVTDGKGGTPSDSTRVGDPRASTATGALPTETAAEQVMVSHLRQRCYTPNTDTDVRTIEVR